MKKGISSILLMSIVGLLMFSACKSSTVWGHNDVNTPTKFRSDRRTIK